ncbi:hypothetical protein RHABOEDO_001122 [Candidatus Rhabdochlamydia oedothoracis]|uniref:Uncharacterized protein n=1 Tax=Candidatus Rhabdochlamydia oedothoracis TaxID=2720720 RepID=A0ABX8V0X7_9BACT|nr:hypothetical protein RHOW815_001065 [Candidatus Rhabdochlamydia sp. W815]QYF48885.1 hypothetical protein RHABOEDO_001122 [Candidatus Rhabdochlamydia oedothoracis]
MYKETTSLCPSIKMILFDHDDTLVGTLKAKLAHISTLRKRSMVKNLKMRNYGFIGASL